MGMLKTGIEMLENTMKANNPINEVCKAVGNGVKSIASDLDDFAVTRMSRQALAKRDTAFEKAAALAKSGNAEAAAKARTNGQEIYQKYLNKNYGIRDYAGAITNDINGNFSYKRTAIAGLGAYAAGDATYRLLSGGGLYRNSEGEFNVVGIPGL